MLDLGNLKISIEVDSTKATRELAKTKGEVKGVGDSAENAGGKFSSMKAKVAIAAAAVVAIGAVAIKVGKQIKKLADETAAYGDAIDKESQKMQISAEGYQKWAYVLERNGASINSLKVGMKTFTSQMEKGSSAFKKLGVATTDANGKFRDSEKVMTETMKALAGVKDKTERATLANELFGKRTAQELLPTLNSGADGIEDLMNRAEELGFVMSDKTVKACAEYQDAMTDVNKAAEGLKNNIIAAVIPGMAAFASKASETIGSVSTTIHKYVSEYGATGLVNAAVELVGKFVLGMIQAIPKVIEGVATIISNFADAIENGDGDYVASGVKIVTALAKGLIKAIPQLISAVASLVSALLSKISQIPSSLYNIGRNAINNLLAGFKAAWASLKSWVSEKTSWIANAFSNAKSKGTGHRIGLNEVPYDGYQAVLHKGERVLTAAEVNQMNAGNGAQPTQSMTVNFNGSYSFMDKKQIDYFMKQAETMIKRRLAV